ITGADRVRAATDAHMLFLHHPGKDDTRGARGHSSLLGAVDTEVEFKRDEDDIVTARVTKQRDGEHNQIFAFKIRPVSLGWQDRRGKTVTSIVVEPAAARGPKLNEAEQEARDLLSTLIFESNKTRCPVADWRKDVMGSEKIMAGRVGDNRRKYWQRIYKS